MVCDGHADMENIILDDLHPEAKLISGAIRPSLQMQDIENGFDAFIAFGHAGGGVTLGGVLDHTYNSKRIYNIRLNGIPMNTEAVFNAVIAGYYNIPLVTIIGDAAVNKEVQSFIPNVESVVVKKGISRFSAVSIHPSKARQLIYEGVKRGLERRLTIKPLKISDPLTMEIDFKDSNCADTAELIPGVVRISPRTISFTGDSPTVFRLQELLIFRLLYEYNSL